jgi:hypothetical protein
MGKELDDLLYEVKDILAYYLDCLESDSYNADDWIRHVSDVKNRLEKVIIENGVLIMEDKK